MQGVPCTSSHMCMCVSVSVVVAVAVCLSGCVTVCLSGCVTVCLSGSVTVCPCTGSSRQTLRPYVTFHAALRSAHQSFLSKLEESTRAMLRQTLDAATSEFAVNMLASLPDVYPDEVRGRGEKGGAGQHA